MNTTFKRLEKSGAAIAGLCLVAIMFLVGSDAVARYALGAPIPWVTESVSYYLMVAVSYLAAADTFRHGDHIRLELFTERMGPRLRAWVDVLLSLFAAMVFAVLAYSAGNSLLEALHEHEYIHGSQAWPVWLSYLPIVLGAALLAVRLVHHCVMVLSQGKDPALELQEEF
ncbi:TRAP transporter small permease [Pseudomonas sp. Teo4]|uniref:TRAP transporter small permease n=1 Tax=Pseudomonas sp. Teo4 TaxID=3064528 RepID=UPI002ACB05BD|nr:TRAP transporter small permease [Pseudomonas sp. Teo4]